MFRQIDGIQFAQVIDSIVIFTFLEDIEHRILERPTLEAHSHLEASKSLIRLLLVSWSEDATLTKAWKISMVTFTVSLSIDMLKIIAKAAVLPHSSVTVFIRSYHSSSNRKVLIRCKDNNEGQSEIQ